MVAGLSTEDTVIEAITAPQCFGVQFHPEWFDKDDSIGFFSIIESWVMGRVQL